MAGVLSDVNAVLATMHIRSHDPDVKFTWVKSGLQSLSMVSAMDMPGVVNSVILALGVHTRGNGNNLPLPKLLALQRVLYLFAAMHRNLKMKDHTEEELDDLAMLIILFEGAVTIVPCCCAVLLMCCCNSVMSCNIS